MTILDATIYSPRRQSAQKRDNGCKAVARYLYTNLLRTTEFGGLTASELAADPDALCTAAINLLDRLAKESSALTFYASDPQRTSTVLFHLGLLVNEPPF